VRAQRFFDALFAGQTRTQIPGRPLSATDAQALQTCLTADAIDSIYSATITLAEAFQGLSRDLHTWATVKFYYSAFYSARCLLHLQGSCVFYVGTSPFHIHAEPGRFPSRGKGSSHKTAFELFATVFDKHVLLSQEIGGVAPHEWLMDQREEANYRKTRFVEPDEAERFKIVSERGVRKILQEYLADDSHLFTFDPDHAMMAYPLQLWRYALAATASVPPASRLQTEAARYLGTLLRDHDGPLSAVIGVLRQASVP
jgi:uncharacterized protein (UPF0332 family)